MWVNFEIFIFLIDLIHACNIYYYKQTQRLMPPSVKNRQMQIKQKLKRFHFDPCPKINRNTSAYSKQKISDIIMADDHVDFSTVNQKNDFNDSSWLAKLVNGIEEDSGTLTRQPLSDIGVQLQFTDNSQKNQLFPRQSRQTVEVTRKNSTLSQKNTSRKSVPSLSSTKRVRQTKNSVQVTSTQKQQKKQEKCIEKSSKPKYQRWTSEQSQLLCQPRKSLKSFEKRNKLNAKQQTRETHKNSLINYSSIQQDDINLDTKQDITDKIVIDLDNISLKTQISKQNTPIQTKTVINSSKNKCKENMSKKYNKDSQNKQNQRNKSTHGQNLMSKFQKLQKSDKKVSNIEKSPKKLQNSPMTQKSNQIKNQQNKNIKINNLSIYQKKENQHLIFTEQFAAENRQAVFTSHNQFLDTFKMTSSSTINTAPKFGAIRKNVNCKKEEEESIASKLKIRQFEGQSNLEMRFPTFNQRSTEYSGSFSKADTNRNSQLPISPFKQPQSNIRKQFIPQKQQQITRLALHKYGSSVQFPIESPKFFYPLTSGLNSIKTHLPNKYGCSFSVLFHKLDQRHQQIIHKDNCQQSALNEQQKYQIGSILSKIKYLNRAYNEVQFVSQCKRLQQKIHKIQMDQSAQKQQVKMSYLNDKHVTSSLKKDREKNFKIGDQNIYLGNFTQKHIQDKLSQKQMIRHSQFHSNWFSPLFPQTKQIRTQSLAPNKCPYLQMPSIQLNKTEVEPTGKGDIGTIIDSLNSKLTNYIQTNNLEDTYRKFKLEFAQLRRNMQY